MSGGRRGGGALDECSRSTTTTRSVVRSRGPAWTQRQIESVPFYKALLRINPIHPGANHELVHFHEGAKRPALGWPNARGYMASSPGIPHAFHMQAHLAMRIGKWDSTTDWSWKAIEMERAYHTAQRVKSHEDHQYSHHLETLTTSLVHDGRFREAAEIRDIATGHGYKFTQSWFRMLLGQRDWAAADKIIAEQRKSDKVLASYMAAIAAFAKGDTAKAAAEVDVLRQVRQTKKNDRRLDQRLDEIQGRLLCLTGSGEAGIKLLKRNIEKTKDDYYFHAWGGGYTWKPGASGPWTPGTPRRPRKPSSKPWPTTPEARPPPWGCRPSVPASAGRRRRTASRCWLAGCGPRPTRPRSNIFAPT